MNQANNNVVNDFLKSFPRKEIVEILSSIDKKIGSLHTISSKDFLYFNKLLKQFYSSVKEISTANNTISAFVNNDLPKVKERIKDKNAAQIELLNDTEGTMHKIIHYLNCVYASFDLLVVPVNNFKQNLITLKYILANLKLHLNYIQINNVDALQQCIVDIEKDIEDVQTHYENLNTETDSVLEQIIHLKNNSCISENLNNSELKDELKKVLNSFKRISFDHYLPENTVSQLNNHTQKSFSYLGEVITNIQYHDIIRQKMEHIQTSQIQLIQEINKIDTEEQNSNDQIGVIVKIPEITDIQVAQLLYTNKDYQTSIEKITNQLIEVGHEMKAMDELYNTIHENSFKFEDTFVNQVVITQQIFESYYELLVTNWDKTNNKLNSLDENYNKLKSDFTQVFQSEKKLRSKVRNFEQLVKENGKTFGNELMKRLSSLFTDIQLNSNSLKTHLNNITQNLNFLHQTISSFKPNEKNNYIDHSATSNLSLKSDEIKQKTKEYANLSDEISTEIAQSIKKIEYYGYFKDTVEQIVTMLNKINNMVNYESLRDVLGENKQYLEKIKQLYTMKSERDVHSKLTETGMSANDIIENNEESSYDLDDGDLELF